MSQALTHYVRKKKLAPIAAFDIETEGMGGPFIEGAIAYCDRPTEYILVNNPAQLLAAIIDEPGYIYYAHNGAGYDFSYLVHDLLKYQQETGCTIDLIKQGASRIIGIKIKREKQKTIELRDSLAILPMSLAKAAEAFAPDLPKLHSIDFEHGEVYDPANSLHRDYLFRDVDSLIVVVVRYAAKIFDVFGTQLGFTAASTALMAWQASIAIGHTYFRMHKSIEQWVREAYFGGYVYPGNERGIFTDCVALDFNAAYAAIMRKGVPCGTPAFTTRYEPDKPGIYEVDIIVPRSIKYPFIPSRDERTGQLRWCTGEFSTRITSLEIEFALRRGCTVNVRCGYVWFWLEYPFNAFLDKLEALELAAKEAGEEYETYKLQRNSLYGKFGTRPTQEHLTLSADIVPDSHQYVNEDTGEIVEYLWITHEESNQAYIQPHWAAWITAGQRLRLFALMEGIGIEHVRYADTDSVTGDRELVNQAIAQGYASVGSSYGQVKVDKEFIWFQCLGVKNYRGLLADGSFIGKVKGIPRKLLTMAYFDQAAFYGQSDPIAFTSTHGPLQLIKGKVVTLSEVRTRRIGGLQNSLSWRVDSSGKINGVYLQRTG